MNILTIVFIFASNCLVFLYNGIGTITWSLTHSHCSCIFELYRRNAAYGILVRVVDRHVWYRISSPRRILRVRCWLYNDYTYYPRIMLPCYLRTRNARDTQSQCTPYSAQRGVSMSYLLSLYDRNYLLHDSIPSGNICDTVIIILQTLRHVEKSCGIVMWMYTIMTWIVSSDNNDRWISTVWFKRTREIKKNEEHFRSTIIHRNVYYFVGNISSIAIEEYLTIKCLWNTYQLQFSIMMDI